MLLKIFPKESCRLEDITREFYQISEEILSNLHKLLQKKSKEHIPAHSMIQHYPGIKTKDIRRKQYSKTIVFKNTDPKLLNKILTNQIHQYF